MPIAASEYAATALGFFSAEIEDLGDARWRIGNRGRLATIRFDRSIDRRVDFARSSGVIGQMHLQGSLYVALDPDDTQPIIALAVSDPNDGTPAAPQPYLVESRWPIRKLTMVDSTFSFQAQGFGVGSMTWRVEAGQRYRIVASDDEKSVESFAEAGDDGLLAFTVRTRRYAPATVSVSRISGG